MSKHTFTKEQREALSQHVYVAKCSARSITFTPAFKEHAVQQYHAGYMPTEIFRSAGFDPVVIGKRKPKECLERWQKTVTRKGVGGLSATQGRKKGGRPKKTSMTEKERVAYLEDQVAYLKKENAFLAQLRAKRAE